MRIKVRTGRWRVFGVKMTVQKLPPGSEGFTEPPLTWMAVQVKVPTLDAVDNKSDPESEVAVTWADA